MDNTTDNTAGPDAQRAALERRIPFPEYRTLPSRTDTATDTVEGRPESSTGLLRLSGLSRNQSRYTNVSAVEASITELVARLEITVNTATDYVGRYVCRELIAKMLVVSTAAES